MIRFVVSTFCGSSSTSAFRLSQISGQVSRHLNVSSARQCYFGEPLHRTSYLDKKILVWTKRYPSVSKVPNEVSRARMKRAKDVFRIRVSFGMALGIWGFGVAYVWMRKLDRWQNPKDPESADPKPPT
ncbi:hypothetical protein ACOMHN_031748 [Nucella lapillus]